MNRASTANVSRNVSRPLLVVASSSTGFSGLTAAAAADRVHWMDDLQRKRARLRRELLAAHGAWLEVAEARARSTSAPTR